MRLGRRSRVEQTGVDLTTSIGSVRLTNPVMTASGTAGHADELARYVDLGSLGAVVTKSVSFEPWPGNPAPRMSETPAGMINSVGLQGPGVEAWLAEDLPQLIATGARVVASIWGRSVDDYAAAAVALARSPAQVVAVEVNLSCPNVEHRGAMFAHSPAATAAVINATAACGRPRWAKLSPNVTDVVEIAAAAQEAGAEAVTLINTVMGMAIDPETRRPRLGSDKLGGGVSGAAIHPVAVRAVFDVHAALPEIPIVGVGGVTDAATAVELILAGATGVQVGTASFADPRAVGRILRGLQEWCVHHGVSTLRDLIGEAHG